MTDDVQMDDLVLNEPKAKEPQVYNEKVREIKLVKP